MASRKAKSIVFRSPTGVNAAAIKATVEKDLGAGVVTVVQELQSGEYLVEVSTKEQAEQLIGDGFELNGVHVQPSPPTGMFTNVSIMGLRAYIEDNAVMKELEKYGVIKSEVIRLKYKTGHELAGIENGNRLVRMLLKTPSVPYSLKIEGEWCRVIHTNQKPICNVCFEEGHRRAECPSVVCFNCGERGHIRAQCKNDAKGEDANKEEMEQISEEDRRMRNEELVRTAAETDKDLRDQAKGLTEEDNLDDDDDDDFNGYTSHGYESANEPPEQTMRDLGYTENDKVSNPTVKTIQTGTKRELSGSSDDDTVRTRRQRLKPEPNVLRARNKKAAEKTTPKENIDTN